MRTHTRMHACVRTNVRTYMHAGEALLEGTLDLARRITLALNAAGKVPLFSNVHTCIMHACIHVRRWESPALLQH